MTAVEFEVPLAVKVRLQASLIKGRTVPYRTVPFRTPVPQCPTLKIVEEFLRNVCICPPNA